jgi:hypothetical protein
MAKDDRLWAPFPIEMDEHPKIIGLSDAAFRAVFEATFYSRRMQSDGFLDERVVLKRWGQPVADELSCNDPAKPSWVRVDQGWQIYNFGKYHPLRAEIEEKRALVAQRRSRAGKNGAAKRWGDNDEANEWQSDSKAVASDSSETETETETETSTKNLVQKPAHDYASEFSQWWALYPRKQGKADALKAFKAVRKTVDLKTLMNGAQAYSLLNIETDKSHLKMPAGWLRGERWEDEQIVNATRTTVTSQPAECLTHRGYPLPCDRCAQDAAEGREF